MSKLREQFEHETGKIANNDTGIGDYSGAQADSDVDCDYIKWLESKVVEKFTSNNTQSTKSLCDKCINDCVMGWFIDNNLEDFVVSKCPRHRTL